MSVAEILQADNLQDILEADEMQQGVCRSCTVVAVHDGHYCDGCVADLMEYLARKN